MKNYLCAPLDVQIEMTDLCNQKCYYCYNYWRHKNDRSNTLNEKQLIYIFNKLAKLNVLSVTLTGGEPFLNKTGLFKSIELSKKKGIHLDINSNLTLLDKEILNFFVSNQKVKILTSLLSYRSEIHDTIVGVKGSFNKIVGNIKLLIKNKLPVSVNMVLINENFNDLYETAKFVSSLGVKVFCAIRATASLGNRNYKGTRLTTNQIKQSLDTLLKIESELGIRSEVLGCYPKCIMPDFNKYHKFLNRMCLAGKTSMTVSTDGNVRPCSHSNMVYGNIFKEEIEIIWLRMKEWRDEVFLPDFCKNHCKFSEICTGGCRVEAQCCGDIRGLDPDAEPQNISLIKPLVNLGEIPCLSDYLAKNKEFFLNKNIVFRKENFGGIVYIKGTRNFIPINKKAFLYLLKCFRDQKLILFKDFLIDSGATNKESIKQVKKLFYRLAVKEFFQENKK